MKLVVVGDPERKKKDAPLAREGKKIFDESSYVSIDDIRIEIEDGLNARVDSEALQADCILPMPTDRKFDMFCALIRAYQESAYMPYSFSKYMQLRRNILALSKLRELGYATGDFRYGISPDVFEKVRDFPIDVIVDGKVMDVGNKRQLMRALSLRSPGHSIMIKRQGEDAVTKCMIIGNSLAAAVRLKGKKAYSAKISRSLSQHISDTVRFLGIEYACITLRENEILHVSLTPDIGFFEKHARKNIASMLLRHIKKKVESERSVLEDFMDFFKKFRLNI